jgi:hypothetical protein
MVSFGHCAQVTSFAAFITANFCASVRPSRMPGGICDDFQARDDSLSAAPIGVGLAPPPLGTMIRPTPNPIPKPTSRATITLGFIAFTAPWFCTKCGAT